MEWCWSRRHSSCPFCVSRSFPQPTKRKPRFCLRQHSRRSGDDETSLQNPGDFLNFGQEVLRAVRLSENNFVVHPREASQLRLRSRAFSAVRKMAGKPIVIVAMKERTASQLIPDLLQIASKTPVEGQSMLSGVVDFEPPPSVPISTQGAPRVILTRIWFSTRLPDPIPC